MNSKTATIYRRAGELLGRFNELMPGCDISLTINLIAKAPSFQYRVRKWIGENRDRVFTVDHSISETTLWGMKFPEEYARVHAKIMNDTLENQTGLEFPDPKPSA